MKCSFCERRAVDDFPQHNLHFCISCGQAFREGFEHGRVYESVNRRKTAGRKKGE